MAQGRHSIEPQGAEKPAFRRTWGHTMLLVLSFIMLAAAIVLMVYCGSKYFGVRALGDEFASATALVSLLYVAGLVLGISMLVPAIIGIVSGMRSRRGTVALVMAGLAIFIDIVVVIILIAAFDAAVFGALLYGVAFAVLPVLYGIAALRIRKG